MSEILDYKMIYGTLGKIPIDSDIKLIYYKDSDDLSIEIRKSQGGVKVVHLSCNLNSIIRVLDRIKKDKNN